MLNTSNIYNKQKMSSVGVNANIVIFIVIVHNVKDSGLFYS